MKLNAAVAEAINRQINSEMQASYVYLAMAAYFDANELSGFSNWFRAHSVEETGHAMKLYDYLVKRGARVDLQGIEAPDTNFSSPLAAVDKAVSMEAGVTQQIHELFELAHETKEYGTQPIMHWFLDEQNSEEDLFRGLQDQVAAAGDSRWHLLDLDRQLATRAGS